MSGLGFKYSRDVADLVDADEYRAFFASGRMTDDEVKWLRQFLSEYYGRPSKGQLIIHDPALHYKTLDSDQRSRRRDITSNTEADLTPNKLHARSIYSPSDYRKGTSNPEDIYIAKQQYALRRGRRAD